MSFTRNWADPPGCGVLADLDKPARPVNTKPRPRISESTVPRGSPVGQPSRSSTLFSGSATPERKRTCEPAQGRAVLPHSREIKIKSPFYV
jgi:hypothetical protein